MSTPHRSLSYTPCEASYGSLQDNDVMVVMVMLVMLVVGEDTYVYTPQQGEV